MAALMPEKRIWMRLPFSQARSILISISIATNGFLIGSGPNE